ncbi:AMP-binding protein [Halothiobacillus diazotrophicus]|uniref:AMP-binding protein n=1 Tax=Halothiobacillus diazotrophicus TaxID=1860122 RepID=UPI0009EEA08D|nr:AMP-binding protein [Halothiobacillus diazotrophicus]
MPPDLIDRLHHVAALAPDRIALRHGQQSIAYGALAERIRQTAARLIDHGLQPGDRLLIWANKRPETVIMLLAALAAGIVFVPLHPALRPAQLRQIFQRAEARGLIVDRAHAQALTLSTDAFDATETEAGTLGYGTSPDGMLTPFTTRVDTHHDIVTPANDRTPFAPATGVRPDALAALLYTSGSTGQPKGVMVTRANLTLGARAVADYLGMTADDEVLSILPLSFDYGLSQITTALTVGAGIHLQDYLLPNDLKKPLTQGGITLLAGTPGLLIPLSRQAWLPDCPQLRNLTNSGGRLPVSSVQAIRSALPATRLFLMYGLTEAFRASFLPPDETDAHPDSIGRAFPETTLGLVDEQGHLYPENVAAEGELIQGGPLVTAGYFNDPAATAERFRMPPAGWPNPADHRVVFSGDRVRRDAEGRLYFVSRLDDQIKHQGFRVSPEEIEAAALQFSGVHEALAFGYTPSDGPDAPPDAPDAIGLMVAPPVPTTELARWLKQALAPYQQPDAIRCRDELPRSANGKLDRHAARAQFLTEQSSKDEGGARHAQ